MAIALNLSPPAVVRRRRLRKRLVLGTIAFLLILVFLWFVGLLGGNVRVVESGRFYRSAQLSGANLETVIERYRIRSVVNLRGPSDRDFYLSERAICRKEGVAHYDLSLSAYRLPTPLEVQGLVATLDRAPRPVLIHCQQGADRSGMASTIYQALYEGVPLDRAERDQLTWRYGHFAFVGTWRLARFFDPYRQTAKGEGLRTWIENTYPTVYAREKTAR